MLYKYDGKKYNLVDYFQEDSVIVETDLKTGECFYFTRRVTARKVQSFSSFNLKATSFSIKSIILLSTEITYHLIFYLLAHPEKYIEFTTICFSNNLIYLGLNRRQNNLLWKYVYHFQSLLIRVNLKLSVSNFRISPRKQNIYKLPCVLL